MMRSEDEERENPDPGQRSHQKGGKRMKVLEVIVYGVISYFVATVIHEFGHVLAGLMNKWKLILMVVGPFKLYREDLNGKIKFGLEKNVALWGGCGGTAPMVIDDSIDKVFARILIAGPLASSILGIAGIAAFILTKHDFFLMLGMIAFGEGVACILPMNIKTGILYNDGTRFKRIISKGKEAEEEKAIISMVFCELANNKEEFKRREEHLIEVLLDSDDASYRYYGIYYAYMKAKEEGNEEKMNEMKAEAELHRSEVSKFVIESCVMS